MALVLSRAVFNYDVAAIPVRIRIRRLVVVAARRCRRFCKVHFKIKVALPGNFLPSGELVAGDVMLAQKIALETDEIGALAVAHRFVPLARRVGRRSRYFPSLP
jgi:hypothetical protein